MIIPSKDPIGQAILDYANFGKNDEIIVMSDICDDDVIPSEYLYREFDQFPEIEKQALKRCKGKVLDVGAGAGIHAKFLINKGLTVDCIDISPGSVDYLTSQDISAKQIHFMDYADGGYDTILLLMNGIGLAGTLDKLHDFLIHAKSLLNPGGIILCDSTDIKYLYEDDDGGTWVDLTNSYYGNVQFQMKYKDIISEWFEWLYVDFNNLAETSRRCGLKTTLLIQQDESYLAQIELCEQKF